jgi:coenzyme F420-reducing hydrogenase gamma subunit
MSERRSLAVFKLASCDGCQLTLLDCEDELLALAGELDIAYFPEAGPTRDEEMYDLAIVEGSITTPEDARRIHEIRAVSRHLVAIGACAVAGGIQALRNFADVEDFMSQVYASPEYVATLQHSTPASAHVQVDFELQGCPPDKRQLLEVISAYLNDRRPAVGAHSVCVECKRAGNVCVMVAHGTPCLGPVTHAGCGALCPSYHRGCYGCFGPMEAPNPQSLGPHLGLSGPELVRVFRTFYSGSPAFGGEHD